MKKRILSILLTLCMVLTMMPATVFAADGEVVPHAHRKRAACMNTTRPAAQTRQGHPIL